MLIDKGIVEGEVVTIKIVSGEELVAKLVEDGPAYVKLSKPLVLSMGPQGVGMIPFLFTVDAEKDIKLNKSNIVVMEVTDKQFANQYLQGTTGIAMR